LFVFAHLVWIAKLREELLRIVDTIDAEIETLDAAMIDPQTCILELAYVRFVESEKKGFVSTGVSSIAGANCGGPADALCMRQSATKKAAAMIAT